MQFGPSQYSKLEQILNAEAGKSMKIGSVEPIYGGDINQSFLIRTNQATYFLKINQPDKGSDFFEKEMVGLTTLINTQTIRIPKPVAHGRLDSSIFLLTEFLERGEPIPTFWEDFGTSLAALHCISAPYFGFESDNYIGSLEQSNKTVDDWPGFYANERILKLVFRAGNDGRLGKESIRKAEKLCSRFPSLLPSEPSSLLHGDLWNGNFMVSATGRAALFDPSVYYGSREMDLAMTRLFGGFQERFYQAYQEAFPLQPGYNQRIDLYQLYPLLVHLILFGGHYRQSVIEVLDKYS